MLLIENENRILNTLPIDTLNSYMFHVQMPVFLILLCPVSVDVAPFLK